MKAVWPDRTAIDRLLSVVIGLVMSGLVGSRMEFMSDVLSFLLSFFFGMELDSLFFVPLRTTLVVVCFDVDDDAFLVKALYLELL